MGLRLLALACLVGAAFAGPFQRESRCATQCKTSPYEKFNYEPVRKYVYEYKGVNYLNVGGSRKLRASIIGTAEIHVKSKCDLVLRLKNVRIEHKARAEETTELLRKLVIPMPFAYEDGKIDHVCPHPEESQQSQNIKKGILSTIINTMTKLDRPEVVKEDDSLGTCVTKYTVKHMHGMVIEKEKSLKSCTNRHTSVTALITNPYDSPESDIQTLPIFPDEQLSCRQVIENRIIEKVRCKEHATIQPLKKLDSVIEFEGEIELKLRNVEAAESMELHTIHAQEPIMYNFEEAAPVEDQEREVEEILRRMCSKNFGVIDVTVSKDFFMMVSLMKHLPYESLEKIYTSLENHNLCASKKVMDVFLDTLPMAGSGGTIKLMVKVLLDKKVTGLKAKLWTASLALVPHPTHEAIAAIVPLLKKEKSASVLLGVSAMVHRFCIKGHCSKSSTIREIVSELNLSLGQHCSSENETEVIAALKALGNIGYLGAAETNVLACAKDSEKSIRLRLAAIDAFRLVNKKRPEALLHMYTNTQEHYEVRIAALSSVLKKADVHQLRAIKTIAEKESDIQVNAYTSTLINNVNKTTSPLKRNVHRLLQDLEVKTPKVGYWENSKNVELSYFSEPFNVGAAVESDIIHAPKSKIPRSITSRFDLHLFGKHVNVLEVGVRATGIENAFKKLIGLKEKNKQKSSWNFLRSSNEDSESEAAIFFRTMDIELLDLSISDLSGMGQMFKIADVLNKISHDKNFDFSHSFLFMNSKLIIPSVTGRSYSFGVTGSATVGLTASSKVDIVNLMSNPRNCDVHGRLQPSVNVEIAATAGIQSTKHRPDIKVITRLHSEADMEARFQVKDGHMALANVYMPSENIALANISSEVVEVDNDHSEKPVYQEMQKKIDYCFNKLEKPFGVSVCGKWEVPRPFMSKTFPYIKGVGNVELSLKKSDISMKGFELSLEIPKRRSQLMKFRASLDTPNSRINRRFSADLEVQNPSQGQHDLSLRLQSPFKSASGSGSLTVHDDLVKGYLEFISNSSRRYSLKVSTPISSTPTEKIYKPSIEIQLPSSQPVTVDGTVSLTKGRKQQIGFEIKSNKPSRKPLHIKGSLMREGRISLSKEAEWKLSSDVALRSPFVNLQARAITEKQAKQAQTISTSLSVDYQRARLQKQSIKLTGKWQKSSGKMSSFVQYQMTELPWANWALNWNMQGKLREFTKNDITLMYGRDPEHTYINILQSTRILVGEPSECKLAIKAPQFDLDSEWKVVHELKKGSKIYVESDLRYREDKHIKGLVHWEKVSEDPIKMKMKLAVELPTRKLEYSDEIVETSPNAFEGNAALQWREDKRAELKYKIRRSSTAQEMLHEIESALRIPGSRSPIKSKASIQMSSESIGFEGRLSLSRTSEYSLRTHLNKRGNSYVTFKLPKASGDLKLFRESQKRAVDLDLKLNMWKRSRHITASAGLGWGDKKKAEVKLLWDADRDASKMLLSSLTLETERKGSLNTYAVSSKLQLSNIVNLDTTAAGDVALFGSHEASFESKVLDYQPIGVVVRHSMTKENLKSSIKFSKNRLDKAELSFEGLLRNEPSQIELSTSASLKSLDNSFESKMWSSQEVLTRTDSSLALKSKFRLDMSSSKTYESEMNYEFHPNMMIFKAYMNTPHAKFEKQAIGFSFRRSENIIASSATLELSNGKVITVSTESQTTENGVSVGISVRSPFDKLKDAKWQVSYEKQMSKKTIETSLEVNGQNKAEAEIDVVSSSKAIEIRGRMKSVFTPELSTKVTIEKSKESFRYSAQVMKGPSTLLSTSVSKQSSNADVTYSLLSKSLDQTLLDLKLSKEVSPKSTSHILEAKGPFAPLSLALEISRNEMPTMDVSIKACREDKRKECYVVKGKHTELSKSENYRLYKKISLELEKTVGQSKTEHLGRATFAISLGKFDFREKIILEYAQKKYGYELKFHRRENKNDQCSVDCSVFMPHRTLRINGSALHNDDRVHILFAVHPDVSVPTRKLSLELKKEHLKESNEVSGDLSMIYPGMSKPVSLTGRVKKDGWWPVSGMVEIRYSPSQEKKLTLEFVPRTERSGQRSLVYKIYRDDKSIDISVKLISRKSRTEDVYGYEWSSKTPTGEISRSLLIKLSEKRSGWPEVLEIAYVSPTSDLKLKGRVRGPTDLTFSVFSKSERVYEIQLKAKEGCLSIEHLLKSGPFFKTNMCLNKEESGVLSIVDVQGLYRGHESLHVAVQVDPEKPHLANIILRWQKKDFENAWKELRDVVSVLSDRSLLELQEKIKEWYNYYLENIMKPLLRDLKQKFSELIKDRSNLLRASYERIKTLQLPYMNIWENITRIIPVQYIKESIINPIVETIKCVVHKYMTFVFKHIPDAIRMMWTYTMEHMSKCLMTYCERGTFCYDFAKTLNRHGMVKASHLLQKKMSEVKSSALQRVWRVRWISDITEYVRHMFEKYMEFWRRIFSGRYIEEKMKELVEWAWKLEKMIREKATPWVESLVRKVQEIIRRAEKDPDFKVLKELVMETKEKAVSTWERKENLLQEAWSPLRESLLEEYPRKWVRERMEIQEFNPKHGQIKIQIHHPLNAKHVQILQNAIEAIKNKVLQ